MSIAIAKSLTLTRERLRGVWAKKIRSKVHYFGPWKDPQGSLDRFLAERDFLLAGRTPPPEQHTVANLLDQFLGEKQSNLDTGDITQATFDEYETTCVVIDSYFGKHRALDGLTLGDFTGLRKALAKGKRKATLAPVTQKRRLTVARMIFAEQPAAHRKALKSPHNVHCGRHVERRASNFTRRHRFARWRRLPSPSCRQ